MIRQRPWLAAVVAFVTVLGIGGVALGAQTVFSGDATEEMHPDAPPADPAPDARPVATDDTPPATVAPPTGKEQAGTKGGEEKVEDGATAPEAAPKDTTPPDLVILEPADGAQLTEKVVTFSGETEPGATVEAGKYAAEVDDTGHWSIVLVLSPGANKASFVATDAAGNAAWASIVLTYVAPADETKPDDDDEATDGDHAAVDFTAEQVYGSCEEAPPYDVFRGTAAPGSKVKVWSKYGSAKVEAGDSGEWEVKVPFTAAPFGEPFTVTVSSGELIREFSFTSYADPGPVEYTITQIKASSDSPEPYAKFAGTAGAGTVIEASSAYGSASLTVEVSGEWWLKVPFTGQPANEAFPVVVTAAGQTHEFGFTWYQGEG